MTTIVVLVCGIEYFAPSDSECIFRCFEPPFLLFQATCGGDEPLVEVLMLQQFVRREIVRTIIFPGDGLFGLSAPIWTVARWHVRLPLIRPALWLGLCRGGA